MRKISIDAGCAYVKVVFLNDRHQLVEISVPSIIAAAKPSQAMDGTTSPSYFCDGQQWSVLPSRSEPTAFPDYPYSTLNTVLIHHALTVAGVTTPDVEIATCIPLADYFERMDASKDRKRSSLSKSVTLPDGSTRYHLTPSVTVPECLAGWLDLAYDNNGREIDDNPAGDVGLVDVGGRTTDIGVVNNLNMEKTTTLPHGYLDVFSYLNDAINRQFPNTEQFSVPVLDQTLRTGMVEIAIGQTEDVSALVDQSIQVFSDDLLRKVNEHLGNSRHLSGTCFFGGGVEHIRDIIKKMPKTFIPDNPQFSNARGAFKAFRIGG